MLYGILLVMVYTLVLDKVLVLGTSRTQVKAAPIIPPAHTTASSFSWVGNGMPGIRWKKPNTRGYQKLLTRVR